MTYSKHATLRCVNLSAILLIAFSYGCRSYTSSIETSHSELNQLTKEWESCTHWDNDRIEVLLSSMPPSFLRNFPRTSIPRLHSILAGIPDAYMKWLYKVHQMNGVNIIGMPNLTGGYTEENGKYPTSIQVGSAVKFIESSLQHEIGHAIQPLLHYHNYSGNGQDFWNELRAEAMANKNNPNLDKYPKSYILKNQLYHYEHEYWADAFNSYYCSPESNAKVKAQFPSTYQFLQRHLEPPIWETLQPKAQSANLFLALEKPGVVMQTTIATNTAIQNAGICVGDVGSCSDTQKIIYHFRLHTKTLPDKKFFTYEAKIPFEAGKTYTIIASSANNAVQKASFRVTPNQ